MHLFLFDDRGMWKIRKNVKDVQHFCLIKLIPKVIGLDKYSGRA